MGDDVLGFDELVIFLLRGFDPMANQHFAPLFGEIIFWNFLQSSYAICFFSKHRTCKSTCFGANVDLVFWGGKGRKTIDNLQARRVTSAELGGYLQ